MPAIQQPSVMSLRLTMCFGEQTLATGTGFVAKAASGRHMLLTNRHNVTGLDQRTLQPLSKTGGVPDRIIIRHNRAGKLGTFVDVPELLYDEAEEPLWLQHPHLQETGDFAALPLTSEFGVSLLVYNPSDPGPDLAVRPTEPVSVIGYPFGFDTQGLAIWATGFVASETDLANDPTFLIDCRTRPGQSGSPVIAFRGGGMVTMADGGSAVFGKPVWRFLGIYSGRLNAESDLGLVWKADRIAELLASI